MAFWIRDFLSGSANRIKSTLTTTITSETEHTPHHNCDRITDGDYETVAASQTDQPLGATGAAGDYLWRVAIFPATTSPGAVSIKDGGGSSITIFTGGASSVADLRPFFIDLGMTSLSGAWSITTGANVSAIAIGNFT